MKRWIERFFLTLLLGGTLTYCGDWAIYKMRGAPVASVSVHRYMSVTLKGNRQEYDDLGTSNVTCSVSLFPQAGFSTCWQLRRHPNQGIQL